MASKKKSRSRCDSKSIDSSVTHADCLRRSLTWFTRDASFADFKPHGNVGWTAVQLTALAVLWVWSDKGTLTGAFSHACQVANDLFGSMAVSSYQGLTGALASYTSSLLPALWSHFHGRMEQAAPEHWRIGRWLPLAVDGSRVTTPRTEENERAFSAANFGRNRTAKNRSNWKNKKRRSKKLCEKVKPQIWLTLLWHMGLKMPWCWKTGPSTACERHHLQELLMSQVFPLATLFCCDAGFVGYELWKAIIDAEHSFLIRVGANVRLLRKLAHVRRYSDLVYLWPDRVARKGQPPLVLRLLEFQGPRGKVCLVTNVLSEHKLSSAESRRLYRLRWGVELQFRAFKQTFGRNKLRSRTPENALVELNWSLVGLWLVELFAVKEQIKLDIPPEQSSVALALNVVREAMRNWNGVIDKSETMERQFRRATKDDYQRTSSKAARYRPSDKDKPGATEPIVVFASRTQRLAYKRLAMAA